MYQSRVSSGGPSPPAIEPITPPVVETPKPANTNAPVWLSDAEKELKKIPFFVRGKARRNTEHFATEQGLGEISLDTLYEAKAHFAR